MNNNESFLKYKPTTKKELDLLSLWFVEMIDMQELYNTIRKTNIAMSWGIHKPTKFNDFVLWFKVQWFLFKGLVMISVWYDDNFIITLTKQSKKFIEEQVVWVGIENLLEVIDWLVEKKWSDEEYRKMVMNNNVILV